MRRYIRIGDIEKIVVGMLSFFGGRGEVIWGEVLSIEVAMDWNRGIPWKILKITHNYLIFYFILVFWFTFSSFQGPWSWYLILLRVFGVRFEVIWGGLSKIEAATDWKRRIPCKILKITHNHLIYFFYYHFLVHTVLLSDPSVDFSYWVSGSMSIELVGCYNMVGIQLVKNLEIAIYLKTIMKLWVIF